MLLELAGRHPLLRDSLATQSTDNGRLVVDARRLLFASPLDLTATAATAHTHAAVGTRATLLLPDSADVASYMQRMDLLRAMPPTTQVEGQVPDETRSDRSSTLLEVERLRPDTADAVSERLGRVATHHLGPRDGRRVFKGIGELIDNAISHGTSTCGAFIAAQAYSGKTTGYRRLEIAVCDTGIGVLTHLRGNPAHCGITTSAEALDRALQPGVSGTSDTRGNGLPDLLAGTSDAAATRLVLRSGDGLLRAGRLRRAAVTRSISTAVPVRGTWSWLRVSYRH
ncbi:ATP-binding protein [Streptomyces nigra]|uniref:ATP-binding protein n=1 Tax=Streptomyces nigra TaxID=1827580 RepID=A0ABZ1ITU4_9ACTN